MPLCHTTEHNSAHNMALSCTLLFAILSTDCAQKTLWSTYVLNDALGGNDLCKLVFPSTSHLCFRMSKPAVMLQLLLNGYISVVYASFTVYESEKLLEFSTYTWRNNMKQIHIHFPHCCKGERSSIKTPQDPQLLSAAKHPRLLFQLQPCTEATVQIFSFSVVFCKTWLARLYLITYIL